jgi:CBS domain-containing protein
VGHLLDVTVELGTDRPAIRRLAVGRRRRTVAYVDAAAVSSLEQDSVQLSLPALPTTEPVLHEREALLGRDVLDTQVIDVAGKRLARVSDVVLTRSGNDVLVTAVEVGPAGVLRRLGLRRLAERSASRAILWEDLHLTSSRGHELQLTGTSAGVHRLGQSELASVVALLPTTQASEILAAVSPDAAAGALSGSHPRVSARLLHAVPHLTASAVLSRMPSDDAASALRGLPPNHLEKLLEGLESDRAATLRRLLAHPADTAGGLMNSRVLTAAVNEPVEAVRERLAAELHGTAEVATVFVVDGEQHPVGSWEPSDLLAGAPQPRHVPLIPTGLPVQRVIDLFTLNDYAALPVVDADQRLVGVIAVDDVLEELLAERLPGQGHYPRVRRRGRSLRTWSGRRRRP